MSQAAINKAQSESKADDTLPDEANESKADEAEGEIAMGDQECEEEEEIETDLHLEEE